MVQVYEWKPDKSFFIFFFHLDFTASQDYFNHFEPSQSYGGAKTTDPQEKPPNHLQAEPGLSHVTRARLEPTVVRWQVI